MGGLGARASATLLITPTASSRPTRAFAATLLLFVLAIALYGAFALLERRVVDWTPRTDRDA